jgi:hypothetical protein
VTSSAPDSRATPREAADTPAVADSGAERATSSAAKPVSPIHMMVLVLFTIGVLAIPVVVLLGVLLGFDALGGVIGLGIACVLLSALWSFGRDTSMWVTATMRLARTRGLLKTDALTPFEAGEMREVPDIAEAEDESRLDRRRVTRLVAEAQRRSPGLKKPPPE